jgi:hypothetical protein
MTRPAAIPALLLLLAGIAGLAACSTTGLERSDRATTTMDTFSNDIDVSLGQVKAVDESLSQLTRPGQTDVQGAFKTYTNDVAKLKTHGDRWTNNADDMNKRGRQYFAEWAKDDKNYANPRIQAVSEQRRAELGAVYDEIIAASQGVKEAMAAYISDHDEVQTFLSNDLTTKGVEAISPLVHQIRRDGRRLNAAMTRVQAAIANAQAEMVRAGA